MTLLEAAKQALEALERASDWSNHESEDAEFGFRHCCGVADWKPHKQECGLQAILTNLRAAIKQAEKAEHPLAQFITSAGINANDIPHVVVEKLEKAMLTAAPQPEGEQ